MFANRIKSGELGLGYLVNKCVHFGVLVRLERLASARAQKIVQKIATKL